MQDSGREQDTCFCFHFPASCNHGVSDGNMNSLSPQISKAFFGPGDPLDFRALLLSRLQTAHGATDFSLPTNHHRLLPERQSSLSSRTQQSRVKSYGQLSHGSRVRLYNLQLYVSSSSPLHQTVSTSEAAQEDRNSPRQGQRAREKIFHGKHETAAGPRRGGRQRVDDGTGVRGLGHEERRALPDYSMDFSKIREMRKQNKKELSRASLGGDEDLAAGQQRSQPQVKAPTTLGRPVDDHRRSHDNPPTEY
ncbi:hypothetical protein PR202_gb18718 [Eleusine coracana subsp. coracana]|uniref:Uncharacterized protein n=1 Tax=Eleusine coracana subsp. coracana TaxID=191504 RepID=A0AAV5F6Y1_ELECO|nr:hypothetical protein PR202_gb18718 [Eleusine coracana subsp. coracana]